MRNYFKVTHLGRDRLFFFDDDSFVDTRQAHRAARVWARNAGTAIVSVYHIPSCPGPWRDTETVGQGIGEEPSPEVLH